MKNIKKIVALILVTIMLCALNGCEASSTYVDMSNTRELTDRLVSSQPTPTDIEYSLQRYNLIRRAYWMNGYEEKARSLPCEVDKPLGYIYLFLEGVGCVAQYTVDGQITSLRTYLTPDTTYPNSVESRWIADVDGGFSKVIFEGKVGYIATEFLTKQ